MKGFIEFIREQGIVGLAIGFVLGGAVAKVMTALVTDILNPLLGILLGAAGNLSDYTLDVGKAHIMWGDFLSVLIDFLMIALVVYIAIKVSKKFVGKKTEEVQKVEVVNEEK